MATQGFKFTELLAIAMACATLIVLASIFSSCEREVRDKRFTRSVTYPTYRFGSPLYAPKPEPVVEEVKDATEEGE